MCCVSVCHVNLSAQAAQERELEPLELELQVGAKT